jgi:hypothetical protein
VEGGGGGARFGRRRTRIDGRTAIVFIVAGDWRRGGVTARGKGEGGGGERTKPRRVPRNSSRARTCEVNGSR